MGSITVFYAINDFLVWSYGFFEWAQNKLNYTFLFIGFFGFAFWMYHQYKFNEKAKNTPGQIK